MKKLAAFLLALVFVFALVACGNDSGTTPGGDTYDIAMITDIGTIDDKSFNQGTWEGIVAYAGANNISHKYYQPTEQSNDAYLSAIQLAVDGGAKIIVTPGFLFEVPIWEAQVLYPEVNFVLIDGSPNNGVYDDTYDGTIASNTVGIIYAEEQSGYLAGYAAVKDGYTSLGFMGGMAVPAVVRFGYGFVQGADAAAQELGLASIDMKYHYTGAFDATPEAQAMAASWYQSGTEVIFACGGAVGFSVFKAAEESNAKAIGVDVDQSNESETIITSATKGLSASVEEILGLYYAGNFPGGQCLNMDASHDGVSLPMATSKFTTFSQADYDTLYTKLVNNEITIVKDDIGVELPNVLNLGTAVTNIDPIA